MRTFKIKDLDCYITLNDEVIDDFNIDSDYTGYIADYEDVAKYYLAQSELLGYMESFDIEEVEPIKNEIGIIFFMTA